jgi:hypothetical protein
MCFLGAQLLTEQQQLLGDVERHLSRQQIRRPSIGRQATTNKKLYETGTFGSHNEVACQDHACAYSSRDTIEPADHRFLAIQQCRHHGLRAVAENPRRVTGDPFLTRPHLGVAQVRSGAEVLVARRGEHNRTDLGICRSPRKIIDEVSCIARVTELPTSGRSSTNQRTPSSVRAVNPVVLTS